jgi:hypothetical protein
MPRKRRYQRRGRPINPRKRRRATTRAGRAGLFPGTVELRARRVRATTRADLPHDDPLAILYGRELLSREQYAAGLELAALMRRALSGAALASKWRLVIDGFAGGRVGYQPLPGNERAAFLLEVIRVKLPETVVRVLYPLCAGFVPRFVVTVISGHLDRAALTALDRVRQGLDLVARLWAGEVSGPLSGVDEEVRIA